MDEDSAGKHPCQMQPHLQLQEEEWHFYSAGPLDGEIVFTFLGCKMDPGSGLELVIVMKRIKPVICKRCVVMTQTLPPSLAMMLQLLCKGLGSAEPLCGLMGFLGRYSAKSTFTDVPSFKRFLWCRVAERLLLGADGCLPHCQPLHAPAASHGKWGEVINISMNF